MSSHLEVFDNIDHLSGGIGVGDGALVGHGPQLSKGSHQLLQSSIGNVGAVLFQHCQLRLRLWIVHSMAAKDITCSEENKVNLSCSDSCSISYILQKKYLLSSLYDHIILF